MGIISADITAIRDFMGIGITGGIMDIGITDIRKFMYMFIMDMEAGILITGGEAALDVGHM